MHLEELVNKLLKTYVEGEEYFNNLDLNIRNNNKYLDYMIDTVKKEEYFDNLDLNIRNNNKY